MIKKICWGLLCLFLISCNQKKIYLPMPYDDLYLGMDKKELIFKIDSSSVYNNILFYYYKDCLRMKIVLGGCIIKDSNIIHDTSSIDKNIIIEKKLYSNSRDFIKSIDTVLYIYNSTQMEYINTLFILKSKRNEYEGCW